MSHQHNQTDSNSESLKKSRSRSSERTLLSALLLSAPGPALISYAAMTSGSATQLADFLRRSAELVATFVSWMVYRKLRKDQIEDIHEIERLERLSSTTVAIAMSLSGMALLAVGIGRLFSHEIGRKPVMGLIIALLGALVNTWFWRKYRSMNHQDPDPVIGAQQRLYRGKAVVDLTVVTALAAVTLAPAHSLTRYLDAGGSMAVAGYLLYMGVKYLRILGYGSMKKI